MNRIDIEIDMLRGRYPKVEYREDGRWVRVPDYEVSPGWNRPVTDIAFQVLVGHPGAPPYGFYVPTGLRFGTEPPLNYVEPAPTQPPFGGAWGVFSWQPDDGQWRATADPTTGSNLLNWVLGFSARFREGK